ncbi:MAG: V-type ATP synthase subunit F, partial [Actinomycetota bacterium]|nr:V-type ATP synthase subunit F [Actinomycetota bacterium]
MYKIVVVTDPDTAMGFRLAGVDVCEAETQEDASSEIRRLMDDDDTGILAVNEGFMKDLDFRLRESIESTYKPIVVSLPVKEKIT